MRMPFTDTELENFILKVGRTRRGVRRLESPEMQLAKEFGGRLFRALMDGPVGERYREALGAARANRNGLRITLSLTTVPELGAVPWEYLFDSTDFLSISATTPVVRYLDVPMPTRPLDVELPLRILAVISAPSNAEDLDTAGERTKLEGALGNLIGAGAVAVDWLEKPNLLTLNQKLRSDTYHILHFIGHGGFDDVSGEGGLLFEDETGRGRPVSGDQLAAVVRDKHNLRLVLLNSCEGARNSVKDPFSGVAASLVERGIPAVIGMQFEITDRAAVLFASEFYAILAEGGQVDEAVAGARLAIFADHNDVEWATPVLFMRVEDGRLFTVSEAPALPRSGDVALPPKTPETTPPGQSPAAEPDEPAVPETLAEPGADPHSDPAAGANSGGAGELAGEQDVQKAEGPSAELAGLVRGRSAAVVGGTAAQPSPEEIRETDEEVGTVDAPLVRRSVEGRRVSSQHAILAVAVAVAVVAGAFLLWPRPGPPSTGSLAVNPAGALETGVVQLEGRDFAPGEDVDITLDGLPVLTVEASEAGAFSTELELDGRTTGLLEAVGRSSQNQATATFDVSERTATGPPTDGVAVDGSPGILFYSDVSSVDGDELGDDNNLYLMDPETGTVRQLSTGAGHESFPTWSPGYDQIAYARGGSGSRRIHVRDRDTDEEGIPVSPGVHDEYFPAWSHTGWIAYVQVEDRERSSIRRVRSDGTGDREVVSGRFLRSPAWSPDGSRIAFFGRFDDGPWHLWVVNFDGTGLEALTSGARYDRNPNWSPDGTTIVFVRGGETDDARRNEIHLLDLTTGEVSEPLTSNDVQDGNPVWSPDGSRIVFYRARGDGYHLWMMNADGSEQLDLMPEWVGRSLDPMWR